jgi:gamma-glutamylcyclotransferase (GGCT)/AIG2-like uncharacterized protein YtfP
MSAADSEGQRRGRHGFRWIAMNDITHLFVYGTLRRAVGHPMHDVLAQSSTFVGEASVNAKMFDRGNYPGIVLSDQAADRVAGDVFDLASEMAAPVLRTLDEYEGIGPGNPLPHEYTRQVVAVHMSAGHTITAWAYVLTHHPSERSRIVSWPDKHEAPVPLPPVLSGDDDA